MKVTLPRIAAGGFGSIDKINEMMAAIEAAFENTLSRDGDAPNQLQFDLDLNGFNIINTGDSDDPNALVDRAELHEYVDGRASGLLVQSQEIQDSGNLQTVFTLTSMSYSPGAHNLAVYVNGVRKFAGLDYTETSTTVVTFLIGQTLGAKVEFVATEFLANVSMPSHTHPWSQITGAPVFTTRWPAWTEVTGKPSVFTPDTHTHSTGDITSGSGLADARRGIWVQATQPTAGRVGELWFW